MTDNERSDEIKKLLKENKIEDALEQLLQAFELHQANRIIDNINILQNRYSKLNNDVRLGIISKENETVERNIIVMNLLNLTRKLERSEIYDFFSQDKLIPNAEPMSEDDYFRISKTAIIIIELEKIKEEYNEAIWENRYEILKQVYKYSDHTTIRLAKEIFRFLSSVSGLSRSGINSEIASLLQSLVIVYFPYIENNEREKEFEELASQCIYIADSLFYDATIYLKDLRIGIYGLSILKWIYWKGKNRNSDNVKTKVLETFNDLENTLERPERTDLDLAKELLQIYKNDLENSGLSLPDMPDYLLKIV